MRKGFTLIELMIVVAIIAVIAAIAIPNLVASRISSNETAAVACMRTYLGAQNQFHRTDFYGKGFLQYANSGATGGVGFPDLYEVGGPGSGGTLLKMIDLALANAAVKGNNTPRAGYVFDDLVSDVVSGSAYDYSIDCGLGGAFSEYGRSGRNIYVIDVTGVVYQKPGAAGDNGAPQTAYPDVSAVGGGWIPVGSD